MFCKHCGKQFELNVGACPYCGKPLNDNANDFTPARNYKKAPDEVVYCSSCGEKNLKSYKRCFKCGKPLNGGSDINATSLIFAIASIVCLFVFPLAGLGFGITAIVLGKKNKYKTAKNLGIVFTVLNALALIVNAAYLVMMVLFIISDIPGDLPSFGPTIPTSLFLPL